MVLGLRKGGSGLRRGGFRIAGVGFRIAEGWFSPLEFCLLLDFNSFELFFL